MIKWQKKADYFFRKKFTSIAKNSLLDSIEKFLSNEKTDLKQTYLLEIVFLIDWISQTDIMNYLYDAAYENTSEEVYIIKFKDSEQSSSNQIIHRLLENNYIFKNQILDINGINNLVAMTEKIIEVIIFDDFSGTGTTFWKAIEKIISIYKIHLKILVYAWTEQSIKYLNEKCKRNSRILSYEIIKSDNVIRRYDDKLTTDLLQYVESISRSIVKLSSRYGYKNSGTMVALDGLSPNNNLPMLWNNDLQVNDNNWIPLLNRDFKQEVIQKFRNLIFKKYKQDFYESYFNSKITAINLKEFQLCYILYSFKHSTKTFIKSNFKYDTVSEIDGMIKTLETKNLIKCYEGYIEIIDESLLTAITRIDNLISKDVLSEIRDNPKNVNYEFVGNKNFMYNKYNDDLS